MSQECEGIERLGWGSVDDNREERGCQGLEHEL